MNASMVDNHKLLREGVAALRKRAGPDTIAVAGGGNVAGGLGLAAACPALNVIVLDLILPGVGGMGG